MRDDLLPRNEKEAAEFAAAEIVVDVQIAIKKLLKATGKAQSDLANLLDVSPSAVSQILGSTRSLRLETVAKVVHALGGQVEAHFRSDDLVLDLALTPRRASKPLPSDWAAIIPQRPASWEEHCLLASNENATRGKRVRQLQAA